MRRIIIIIIFLGGVGIVRRSKMPVTRREVKRSSEVGDLRLSCKSYSWNFFFWGGGRDCEENYYYNYFFWGGGRDCEEK